MPPPKSPARPSRPAGGAPAPQAHQPGPRRRPTGDVYGPPLQAAPVGDRKEASPPASRSSCARPCPACPRAPTGARRTRGPAWRGRQRLLGDLSPHAGGRPCRGASRERAAPKGPSRAGVRAAQGDVYRASGPGRRAVRRVPLPARHRAPRRIRGARRAARPRGAGDPGAGRSRPAHRAHRPSGACAHEI